jgi:hypothetical protein
VIFVEEKTGVQALDRTLSRPPLQAAKPRGETNGYVQYGDGGRFRLVLVSILPGKIPRSICVRRRTARIALALLDPVVQSISRTKGSISCETISVPAKN